MAVRHVLAAKDYLYVTCSQHPDIISSREIHKSYGDLPVESDHRTIFQHDRDCILYSKSFRRLMHKTQVTYPGTENNEHTRTRLTHTLEVVQIARAIARSLNLNEDLAEAIALGHDLGHTPFGHEGEDFLNKTCHGLETEGSNLLSIKSKYALPEIPFEFKHNYQSVRVLQTWEIAAHVSYPTLEGILKHSSIYHKNSNQPYCYPDILSNPVFHIEAPYAVLSLEGQIVGLADEIAQICHDLDDAILAEYTIRKHLCHSLKQFMNRDENVGIYNALAQNNFVESEIGCRNGNDHPTLRIKTDGTSAFISWAIGYFISLSLKKIRQAMDVYVSSKNKYGLSYFPLDQHLAGEKITLGDDRLFQELKFLQEKYVINNVRINRENGKSDFILKSLIEAYLNKPKQLPDSILLRYSKECSIPKLKTELKRQLETGLNEPNIRYVYGKNWDLDTVISIRNDPTFLRFLWDYVASMTDQYALNEYKMLYLGDPAYRSSI